MATPFEILSNVKINIQKFWSKCFMDLQVPSNPDAPTLYITITLLEA